MKRLIKRYQDARFALAFARSVKFPVGSTVTVNYEQYHGIGMVVSARECPIEKIPVMVGNGNIRWYPLGACSPVKKKGKSK